jgi:hypothetical protein
MEDGHNHTDVLIDCDAWRDDDLDTKRLVVICAMPCPQNASSIEDMLNKVELFKVHFGKKKSTMKPYEIPTSSTIPRLHWALIRRLSTLRKT